MIRERTRRRLLETAVLVVLLSLLGRTAGVAQVAPADSLRADTLVVALPDSLGADTLVAALPDSLRRADSVDPVRPFFPTATPFGSIVPATSPSAARIVSELSLASMRYFTAFDALRRIVPALPLSQGLPGFVRGFSYAGAPPSSVAASYNGRPLDGLAAYGYDLEVYPMEYLERAEIVTGARALLHGTGEALMAVNFVLPRLDVEGSYVRAWYAQDAGDLTGGDLMYSRNVGRRANIAIGFRRMATGTDSPTRSVNQELGTWSVHGNATWRPTPALMLSLTELFVDATRSQNGGLTPESTFDPLSSDHEIVNAFWSEHTLRHDLTLAAEWILGSRAARMLDTLTNGDAASALDSATRLDIAAYGSFGRREIVEAEEIVELDSSLLRTERTTVGVRAALQVPLGFARLEAAAIAELAGRRDRSAATTDYDIGRRQGGLLLEIPVGSALALRGSARFSKGREGEIGGVAAELAVRAGDRLSARFGARVQRHVCPCESDPMGFGDSIAGIAFGAYKTPLLAEGTIAWQDSSTLLSVTAFARRAEPLLEGSALASETITGAELRARIPFWLLALEAHAHGTLAPDGDTRFPAARVFADLFAPLRLIEGNLDLRVGTTLEYQTPFAGPAYDVITGSFVRRPEGEVSSVRQLPLWDAYANARIGTAYLRVAMRNILNVESWSVYRYPERGRSIVLEVTWSFID